MKEDKKLVGGQKKLDVDGDGSITADDFAALRERTQKQMGGMMEGEPLPTQEEQMQSLMDDKTYSEEMQEELEPLPEKPEEDMEMESDEIMEDNYLDFIIDEALNEEEETMLMNELENNPQLSMLFDKVMDVAIEFSGSGPVEGPGSEISDSIPARLSDGEFVFTAKAVEEIGEDNLLSMMKEAEAKADERQQVNVGGMLIDDRKQEVDRRGMPVDEDDVVEGEIRKGMLSANPRLNMR